MTSVQATRPRTDHRALAASTRQLGWLWAAESRFRREQAYFSSMLLTSIGFPLVYLTAMGVGLGAIVQADVDGVDYLRFIAPGLLVATVVSTAGGMGTWPIFSGFKWEKLYEAATASPVSPAQVALGETVAFGARFMVQSALFWLVGLLFGAWSSPWSWLVVPIGAFAALATFTPLMAYTATQYNEGLQFNLIQRLVLMPMFLFAGTFFPLASMPIYLQWIGWISPIWHGTQLARLASYGMPISSGLLVVHLVFLTVLSVAGLLLAMRLFTRRLVA